MQSFYLADFIDLNLFSRCYFAVKFRIKKFVLYPIDLKIKELVPVNFIKAASKGQARYV